MTHISQVSAKSRAGENPFGSNVLDDGSVRFRLWAPSSKSVNLCLHDSSGGDKKMFPMTLEGDGWFSTTTNKAGAGSLYQYQIDNDLLVPDPASRFQPQDIHGPSMVVDPRKYKWQHAWTERTWEEVILYELHVGTFTPEGTFNALVNKLDYLKSLGVTAIELMPVADFPGTRGWGYDGVLLFAPDSTYGTPDDLRNLIDCAHERGVMVFLDVVFNHFGPEGNYLHVYAKQFFNDQHHTPWGAAINFDGEAGDVVRQFYVANTLQWLNEYRFDGLRFDAVHAIRDDSLLHILDEIAEAVRRGPGRERKIHMVLENDDNIARLLERNGDQPRFYDAQWNDDSHHALHMCATGEKAGYYSDYDSGTSARSAVEHLVRCLTEGFAYQGDRSALRNGERRGEVSKHLPSTAFVDFIQNHDQIGNRAFGDRIASLTHTDSHRAISAIYLMAPAIPMIFMGEEWGCKTPFFYFCDLGPDLAPLVKEGRRKEFAKFPEFQDPAKRRENS